MTPTAPFPHLWSLQLDGAGARLASPNGVPGGRRVLVVDDDVDAAESLAEMLRLYGHQVVTAHAGEAALSAAGAFAPEVVFLDLGMRGMDGYEIARRLRSPECDGDGRRRRLIVAVTGHTLDDDRARSRAAGCDAHLLKPVDPAVFVALLRATPG